ncbi:PIG-L family deacetylase [candidate division KSB1 bacterium]
MRKLIWVICLILLICVSNINAQPVKALNSSEIQIALQKLNVLGSVLYFAAHPDDENTSVLVYLSKGKKYRTAYLSLTRGDGGQNLVGVEKGAEIGILRTQELLEARKIDGAEQYFSRAVDFGYTKTPSETFEFWGREQILSDAVWIIRKFRPDIIITRFPPGRSGGHGHHTASALIIKDAFYAAGDPAKFPEQLKYVQPWQSKRLFWNSYSRGQSSSSNAIKIDVGTYDPLLGKSYTELSALSRSMHKSQGFGSSGRRGSRYDYFELVEGDAASSDIFEGIDISGERVPGGQKIENMISDILNTYDPQNPSGSVQTLLSVLKEINKLGNNYWAEIKRHDLIEVIRACAGLWLEAIADDYAAAPGDNINAAVTIVNRSKYPFRIDNISFPGIISDTKIDVLTKNNDPVTIKKTLKIPIEYAISQPYWLIESSKTGRFVIPDQKLIGLSENPPSVSVKITFEAEGVQFDYMIPLLYKWTDRIDGEMYRRFEIRPKVTLNPDTKVCIFPDNTSKKINVRIKSHTGYVSGNIRLKGNSKWKIEPELRPFTMGKKYEEKLVTFNVTAPESPDETILIPEAVVNGEIFDKAITEIIHPHITSQVYFPESKIKAVKLNIKIPGGKIGYIMGSGDEVPEGLISLGYDVTILDVTTLESIDLLQFDAVITGIRAYNTQTRLKYTQPKLLDYVNNGGTLIVQYNVSRGLVTENIGPYPFSIGNDRISVETAGITILDPGHQLLNYPNKITKKDFEGWVQERGLYFASQWDDKYEAVIAGHDPNETNKKGGILFAGYGKGVFIYTGYSWFRQLPAGVKGAYRLFVNLVSAGKYNGK